MAQEFQYLGGPNGNELRLEYEDEELATLPDDKLARLVTMTECAKEVRAFEIKLSQLSQDAIAAAKSADETKLAMAKEFPPTTILEELRRIGAWHG